MIRINWKSNTGQVLSAYQRKTLVATDMMARDFFQGSGKRVPKKTGNLRRMTQRRRIAYYAIDAVFAAGYATVQNRGMRRGARPFKNYTTGGTGAGFVTVGVGYVRKRIGTYLR